MEKNILSNNMNLNEFIWNKNIPYITKLDTIRKMLYEITPKTTFHKQHLHNPNHKFFDDLEKHSINIQWKELKLALWIIRFTRYWEYKYNIDNWTEKVNVKIFLDFFKDNINVSRMHFHALNIQYWQNNWIVSIKKLVEWSNKLKQFELISEIKLNKFLKYLEKKEYNINNEIRKENNGK